MFRFQLSVKYIKQTEALFTIERRHLVIIANFCLKGMARLLEENTGKGSGGGRAGRQEMWCTILWYPFRAIFFVGSARFYLSDRLATNYKIWTDIFNFRSNRTKFSSKSYVTQRTGFFSKFLEVDYLNPVTKTIFSSLYSLILIKNLNGKLRAAVFNNIKIFFHFFYFHFSVQKYVYINGQLIALFIIFF